ncbi:MAG: hypothetical protein OEM84_11245 [Acidimicrobiia bacterium]|nr:hypothetical protein [Acidimicrobiia bacterium]
MTYEKPEVRDFGSIAEHTYWRQFGDLTWSGCSGKDDQQWEGWSQ